MNMGFGWNFTTPPWVTDVSGSARSKCLGEIRADMGGYLPNDSERPKPENSAGAHVGTITRLPSEREAAASAPRHGTNW